MRPARRHAPAAPPAAPRWSRARRAACPRRFAHADASLGSASGRAHPRSAHGALAGAVRDEPAGPSRPVSVHRADRERVVIARRLDAKVWSRRSCPAASSTTWSRSSMVAGDGGVDGSGIVHGAPGPGGQGGRGVVQQHLPGRRGRALAHPHHQIALPVHLVASSASEVARRRMSGVPAPAASSRRAWHLSGSLSADLLQQLGKSLLDRGFEQLPGPPGGDGEARRGRDHAPQRTHRVEILTAQRQLGGPDHTGAEPSPRASCRALAAHPSSTSSTRSCVICATSGLPRRARPGRIHEATRPSQCRCAV